MRPRDDAAAWGEKTCSKPLTARTPRTCGSSASCRSCGIASASRLYHDQHARRDYIRSRHARRRSDRRSRGWTRLPSTRRSAGRSACGGLARLDPAADPQPLCGVGVRISCWALSSGIGYQLAACTADAGRDPKSGMTKIIPLIIIVIGRVPALVFVERRKEGRAPLDSLRGGGDAPPVYCFAAMPHLAANWRRGRLCLAPVSIMATMAPLRLLAAARRGRSYVQE